MCSHRDDPGRSCQSWLVIKVTEKKHSHLGFGDALDVPCPVSVGLDGHDDRLGATGRHRASAIGVIVHPQTHCDDFGLHLPNRREDVRMERI
jgi:hypothetical protein